MRGLCLLNTTLRKIWTYFDFSFNSDDCFPFISGGMAAPASSVNIPYYSNYPIHIRETDIGSPKSLAYSRHIFRNNNKNFNYSEKELVAMAISTEKAMRLAQKSEMRGKLFPCEQNFISENTQQPGSSNQSEDRVSNLKNPRHQSKAVDSKKSKMADQESKAMDQKSKIVDFVQDSLNQKKNKENISVPEDMDLKTVIETCPIVFPENNVPYTRKNRRQGISERFETDRVILKTLLKASKQLPSN